MQIFSVKTITIVINNFTLTGTMKMSPTLPLHSLLKGWYPANNEPMLGQCWPAVSDVGPALTQHWYNVSPVSHTVDYFIVCIWYSLYFFFEVFPYFVNYLVVWYHILPDHFVYLLKHYDILSCMTV